MNLYNKAIIENNVIDFFRGENDFYTLDREWATHNFAFTRMNVIDYGINFGEEKLYKQLENDLINYISLKDFSVDDLNMIVGIIWSCFVYRREEGLLKIDWNISTQLRNLIKSKIMLFKSLKADLSIAESDIEKLKERFNFRLLETN